MRRQQHVSRENLSKWRMKNKYDFAKRPCTWDVRIIIWIDPKKPLKVCVSVCVRAATAAGAADDDCSLRFASTLFSLSLSPLA